MFQFKKRKQEGRGVKKSIYKLYCCHIAVRVGSIALSLVLLWKYHKIELPWYFTCKTGKSVKCSDVKSSDNTLINYGMLSINIFLILAGILELIYLSCKFKRKCPTNEEFESKLVKG